MSALQEVLAVLLGAESEAKRIVADAQGESARMMKATQEIFQPDRENKMSSAREQAKSVIANAVAASRAESEQLLEQGREDRKNMKTHFDENIDTVIGSVLAETVERILSGRD